MLFWFFVVAKWPKLTANRVFFCINASICRCIFSEIRFRSHLVKKFFLLQKKKTKIGYLIISQYYYYCLCKQYWSWSSLKWFSKNILIFDKIGLKYDFFLGKHIPFESFIKIKTTDFVFTIWLLGFFIIIFRILTFIVQHQLVNVLLTIEKNLNFTHYLKHSRNRVFNNNRKANNKVCDIWVKIALYRLKSYGF